MPCSTASTLVFCGLISPKPQLTLTAKAAQPRGLMCSAVQCSAGQCSAVQGSAVQQCLSTFSLEYACCENHHQCNEEIAVHVDYTISKELH